MKALTYHGPHHVKVENVPDPGIEQPDDIILRITATAICGSDLHLYRGKIPQVKHGDIFGHEFMGEVVETGRDVKNIQKGDRVVIPFVIACGDCFFCRLQQYSACENTNDGHGAALNKKQIPPLLSDDKALFLSDIFAYRLAGGKKCPGSARFQRGGFWRRASRIADHRLRAFVGRGTDLCRGSSSLSLTFRRRTLRRDTDQL